jgi:hypothetical protein
MGDSWADPHIFSLKRGNLDSWEKQFDNPIFYLYQVHGTKRPSSGESGRRSGQVIVTIAVQVFE